jgi:hypothetical protein
MTAPTPILNDGYFQIGQDQFPLTVSTANSTLFDGDKVLYYLLEFNEAVLNRYIGDCFTATCIEYNIPPTNTFSSSVVGSTYPINIVPYLQDSGIVFPCLAMWRGAGKVSEKDISTHKWETTLNLLYILPPMQLGHIEQFRPLIVDVCKILTQKNEYGHDISYNGGSSIAPLAGYSAIGVKSYDNLQVNVPGTSTNLPFEMVHIEMWLEEINLPIVPSIYPTIQQFNVDVQLDADPVIDNFINIQEPQP